MVTVKLYAKGQITIPKVIRDELGITSGDTVVIESRNGEAVVRKPKGILESGGVGAPKKRVPWNKARTAAQKDRVVGRKSK